MYLGIDIGGTNLKSAILDENSTLIDKWSVPTNAGSGPDSIISRIVDHIRTVKKDYPGIRGLGVGVPGIVSNSGIVVVAPNLPGWSGISLKEILSSEIDLPVYVDNDANTAARAELISGAGKGLSNFLYITLGTGIGGGIVINGEIFRGQDGYAGEIGHTIIDTVQQTSNELPTFRTGILEEFIGRRQIIKRAKEIAKKYPDSLLNNINDLDVHHISDAVGQNDEAAVTCFEESGRYLGIALASILNILGIYTVIVGGGISQSHRLLLGTALDTVKKRALPGIAERAEILRAGYLGDAGIIGAALLAKKYPE